MKLKSEKGQSQLAYVLIMVVVMLIIVVLVSLPKAIVGWSTQRTFVGTVEKTQINHGDTYFVISEKNDSEPLVYENKDAWFFLKWNSSDVLRDVNVGHTYLFHVYGWRVPLFSWYPNIVSAAEMESAK